MNKRLTVFPVLFFFSAGVFACSTNVLGLDQQVRAPKGFSISREEKISNAYPGTKCINFNAVKSGQSVGILCSSSNLDFISDFGISSQSGEVLNNPNSIDHLEFKVATGINSYDMTRIPKKGNGLFVAEIDCDDDNKAIYRATSTCYVGFMPLGEGEFIYSNFTLENNVKSEKGLDKQNIMEIWSQLNTTPDQRKLP